MTHSKRLFFLLNDILFPLFPMLLWGSLFPMIKIGYAAGGIDTACIPDIIMFAAMRFTICGVLVTALGFFRRETLAKPYPSTVLRIVMMGLFAIVLHYACTYIGLTMTDSSKTALLKQVGALLYICTAFLFIREERFSWWKIAGGTIGFGGIILLNLSGGTVTFTAGDILILLASVCTVISGIMSKRLVQARENSPIMITGISQLFGGLLLLAAAIVMGGRLPELNPSFILSFTYICAASIGGYISWTYIQRTHSLSKLYIIKFAEPLFACILGAILLGEDIFRIEFLLAFVLICTGILLASRKKE